MKTVKHLTYIAAAALFLISCGTVQEPAEQQSDLIEVTVQQFASEGLQLGEPEMISFESVIKANGATVPLPNGMATVSPPVAGLIKDIYCRNGQFVSKNQILMEISGNELIDLQKDFAEASANYKRLQNEYERVKLLYNENVTAEKDFIIAESEFRTMLARYNGLKLKLEAIGLPSLKIENGEFYSSYTIKSPINGYVSSLKVNLGSFIDTRSELIEIIDPAMFQIKLDVFSSDIAGLKISQTVRFKRVNSEDIHLATVSSIGVSVDNATKAIECYAAITGKQGINPKANEFVEAEIITGIDTVTALPSEAIIKSEAEYFILVLDKQDEAGYLFKKVKVEPGRQYNGYTEISGLKVDGQIATKGVYNISVQ